MGWMKKIVVAFMMCLVLAGCGKADEAAVMTETATEAGTETAAEEDAQEAEAEETAAKTKEAENESVSVDEEATETDVETTTESEEETTEAKKEVTEVITIFEAPKTMYATLALNVRRGPSTDYEVVSHLKKAQAVEVTGQAETGWYQFMVDGEAAYASNQYLSETEVVVETPATQNVAAAPQVTAGAAAVTAPAGVIMVGDSRCVQMQAAVGGGGCSWVCENSKEYTWFSETAIPKFDQYVGKGTKVVINMGVNDPEHYRQYVELVNVKAAEWAQRGAKTYFVSVNPVWTNPYTEQADVDTFNANVPGMLSGVTWIDTSSWLNTNGYRLVDGLHYDDPTYVNIFNLIMGSL